MNQETNQNPELTPKSPAADAAVLQAGKEMKKKSAMLIISIALLIAANLAPPSRSGTHNAWFYSDVQGAACKVFGAEHLGGGGECQHFGVGGDVVEPFGEVVGARNDGVVAHDDCTDGYLALVVGCFRLTKCLLHVVFVGVVEDGHFIECRL